MDPTDFVEIGLGHAKAAGESSLFSRFGGFSVLLSGFLSDGLKRDGRATIIFDGLLFAVVRSSFSDKSTSVRLQLWPSDLSP